MEERIEGLIEDRVVEDRIMEKRFIEDRVLQVKGTIEHLDKQIEAYHKLLDEARSFLKELEILKK